jgi:predicted site-specific integrase-resolvase
MYGVHVDTVRRWVRKGIIAVRLIGPTRIVRIEQAEAARHFVHVPGART